MRMTLDECIKRIDDIRRNYDRWSGLGLTPNEAEAFKTTIDTMRKYQKIVDIVSLNDEEFKQCGLKELKEILEVIADGTINSSDCV